MKTHSDLILDLESKGYTFTKEEDLSLQTKQDDIPIIVKVLSIFGGISTMGFVLFLYVLLNLHKSELTTAICGFVFVGSSILLSRYKLSLVFNSFGVTLFLSGLLWIILGLQMLNISDEAVFSILGLLGLVAWFFAGSYLMKTLAFISIGGALIAFNYTAFKIHLHVLIYTYASLVFVAFFFESYFLRPSSKLNPLFYSFRSGSLFVLVYLLILLSLNINHFGVEYKWISSIPFVLILVYLTYKLSIKLALKSAIYPYVITGVICTAAFMAPYVLGGLTVLLLAFYVNYKTGLFLGIASVLYFVSRYYYELDLTLLEKSGVMFVTGIFFILIYFITKKQWNYEH